MATDIQIGDKVTWAEQSLIIGKPARQLTGIVRSLRKRNGIRQAEVYHDSTIGYFVSIARLTRVDIAQEDSEHVDSTK